MIKSLTSMRFLAAMLVFIYHYTWLDFDFSILPLERLWSNLFSHGYIGVSFFYVLSGFVLSYAYQERMLSFDINLKRFYLARLARIYPLHILTLLLAIPLMLDSPWSQSFYESIPFNLSLTHSFIPYVDYFFSFNSPSWSISNEVFFYVLFPFVIKFRTRTLIIIASLHHCFFLLFSWLGWVGGFIKIYKTIGTGLFILIQYLGLLILFRGFWFFELVFDTQPICLTMVILLLL